MGGQAKAAIPSHVVAYLGGRNLYPTTSFALWKDGHMLVIESECIPSPDMVDYFSNPEAGEQLRRDYFYVLETIQTVLSTIEFDGTNWAYLTKGPGGYQLQQRKKTLYKISCPLWAPLIEESEIEITKWIHPEYRVGSWKGREVDICWGWDNEHLQRVEEIMRGYRALRGLDLTFDVLGHVIQDDGAVVGLVTEPLYGNPIEPRDRSIVYGAIAKLEQHGFLFMGISYHKMVIVGGKLRLIDLTRPNLRWYPKERREELCKEAETRHWEALDKFFADLDAFPNYWPCVRSMGQELTPLAQTPAPEKLLYSITNTRILVSWLQEYNHTVDASKKSRQDREKKGRGVKIISVDLNFHGENEQLKRNPGTRLLDMPLHVVAGRSQSRVPYHQNIFHPYRQPREPRRLLLLSDSSSDTASDSGLSYL